MARADAAAACGMRLQEKPMTKARVVAIQLLTPLAMASAVGIAVSIFLGAAVLLLAAGAAA